MSFTIDSVISLSAVAGLGAFLFSVVSFLVSQSKNRRLQRREYADKIRGAAAKPTIALNRRREVTLGVVNDLQPIFVDADIQLVGENDVLAVRDCVWRGINVCLAESARHLLNENLEGAYGELYGYDTRIQTLYQGALDRLKQIDLIFQDELLYRTQKNILEFAESISADHQIEPAALGNKLRATCGELVSRWRTRIMQVVDPVHDDLLRLIHETDDAIVNHRIGFRTEEAFAEFDRSFVHLKNELAGGRISSYLTSISNRVGILRVCRGWNNSARIALSNRRELADDMENWCVNSRDAWSKMFMECLYDSGMRRSIEISSGDSTGDRKFVLPLDQHLQEYFGSICLTYRKPAVSRKIKQPRRGRGHRRAK